MKRFVIIGLGNFGANVAEALYVQGHEVIVLDINEQAVDRIGAKVTRAAVGDARDKRALERLGAPGADVGIVSTGDDIAASILALMLLRDLGVKEVYVKVISHDHQRVMNRLGATDTIFPEHESAVALASRVSGRSLLNYVRLGPGFSIQEMGVPASWEGRTLRTLNIRSNYRVGVVAVHDVLSDTLNPIPDPDTPLTSSDTLLVAGRDEDLRALANLK